MCESMLGYLAVCKSGMKYFKPDLNDLIDMLDDFDKPAKIYNGLRQYQYKRGRFCGIHYTELKFVMEVK